MRRNDFIHRFLKLLLQRKQLILSLTFLLFIVFSYQFVVPFCFFFKGRRGFGNIYVWASGNGGSLDDSCACDGYSSSPFTLSVSGVSESNTRPWYLEKCSSTLASTYSSGSPMERMIVSCCRFCIDCFDGSLFI